MSLINRMLQDLDARAGQPGAAPLPQDVRPVAPPERSLPWKRVAVGAGAAAALALLGLAGWRAFGHQAVSDRVVAVAPAAQPVAPAAAAPVPVVAIEIPVASRQDAADAGIDAGDEATAPAAAAVEAPAARPAAEVERPAAQNAAQKAAPARVKPAQAKAPVKTARPTMAAAAAGNGGRVETPAQRAENSYRRALASLEDGRVTEAIGGLQTALKVDPRHEAARQTLVSLLIEAGRPDEAMRQLATALALEPRQPAMAMLLARLQIERGASGIDTLLRTLPYAAGNGEYHAFLAGALAREGRHREAAEHYGVALRTAPQNGVWWMGLGLALQAEKRQLEAAGAFRKALESGTLSAELQDFVERKLKQLTR